MIQKLKVIIASCALLIVAAVPFVAAGSVSAADIQGGLNCGAELKVSDLGANGCTVDGSGAGDKLDGIITLVINIFSLVVGVIAVIMIIIGGLKYIMSGGDSGNITGAKNTILYAIVGLVVVALAQFVVRFVLDKVGSAS